MEMAGCGTSGSEQTGCTDWSKSTLPHENRTNSIIEVDYKNIQTFIDKCTFPLNHQDCRKLVSNILMGVGIECVGLEALVVEDASCGLDLGSTMLNASPQTTLKVEQHELKLVSPMPEADLLSSLSPQFPRTHRSRASDDNSSEADVLEHNYSLPHEDKLGSPKVESLATRPVSMEVLESASGDHSQETRSLSLATHSARLPYHCEVCGKQFSQSSYLSTHILTHTDQQNSCRVCHKKFSNLSGLTYHMRTHAVEKPFACQLCSKHFSQSRNLGKHILTHTGEKPYQCRMCSRAFKQSCTLKLHVRTHVREKPYECKTCNKRFSSSLALTGHSRMHTGERPHKCVMCNKRFRRTTHLASHILIHTGERPYRCKVCNRQFSQSSTFIFHTRMHVDKKPCQYETSNKQFS